MVLVGKAWIHGVGRDRLRITGQKRHAGQDQGLSVSDRPILYPRAIRQGDRGLPQALHHRRLHQSGTPAF
jgi:hypothetical protein